MNDSNQTHFTEKDRTTLTKVEIKLDRVIEDVKFLSNSFVAKSDFDFHLKTDSDHENRIRTLEESRWKVVAITGIITGFLSVAGSYIINAIK